MRPLILQSDFGYADGAVSAMYGVAECVSDQIRVYDLTHDIPQYDIWEASYRLIQTVTYWPEGSVFVSVVDPGVGSTRRSIVVRTTGGQYVVTPDNGTLTHIKRMIGISEARVIDESINRLPGSGESYTFHGRDIYAYTGARLASGIITFEQVGPQVDVDSVVELPVVPAELHDGIITGNEQYFYTGGRVDPNAPGEKDKYTDALTHFLKASGAVTKPMIAAVNGDRMKAGMGVLALCDFAVARKGVVFNFPEVRMGGVPMMVLVDIVDAMPRKRALEALLTSWNLSAEEALQMGLVNRVVAKEEFWPTVYRFADAMLATQPWLIDMTKQAYEDMVHLKTREERIAYADKMLRGDALHNMATHETTYNV